jgi:hypothetical protein
LNSGVQRLTLGNLSYAEEEEEEEEEEKRGS